MSEPAGPRPGREPEQASFEVIHVGRSGRGRQPAMILGFVAVVAALVTVGVGGRTAPTPTAQPLVAVATSGATPRVTEGLSTAPLPTPRIAPAEPPVVSTLGGNLQLTIRRQVQSIFVHGDVFVPRATWVFVSVQDASGRVAAWSSVSIPGGAGPAASGGPTLRFDVDVFIAPEHRDKSLWVQATAYDATGKIIGSSQVGVRPDGGPIGGPQSGPIPSTTP